MTPGSPTVRHVNDPSADIVTEMENRLMNAYCPECETDLDAGTGICPACRWDPLLSPGAVTRKNVRPPDMSLSERYRGTPYGLAVEPDGFANPAQATSGISRGRLIVIGGLVLSVTIYGVVLAALGPF
jgi:hypothetical protein